MQQPHSAQTDPLTVHDPWAKVTLGGAPLGSHSSGFAMPNVEKATPPIVGRTDDQDKRISELTQVVKGLQQSQDKQWAVQTKMQSDLEQLGQTFQQSLQAAIVSQESQMNTGFADLKALLASTPKRAGKRKPGSVAGVADSDEEMGRQLKSSALLACVSCWRSVQSWSCESQSRYL